MLSFRTANRFTLPKLNPLLVLRVNQSTLPLHNSLPPTQAQVVICGGGAVANSVAYHLTQNGWTDILLVDKGKLCGGTSHFGSGTLGLFKPIAERKIVLYSLKLYRQFQAKGFDIGLEQCGSLNLAQTSDRMTALKRRIAYNVPTGLHCEIINKNELKKLHPFLYSDDLEGAVWVPEDAVANPLAICETLAQLSIEGGAQYIEHCCVQSVVTEHNRVKGVQTNKGFISCEYFVNCAGMWARELGWLCTRKVRVPVYPAEHFYVTTDSLPGVPHDLPYIRDYDSSIYIREMKGGFMVGGFEPNAKPAFTKYRLIPDDWKSVLPVDWDHFGPFWKNAKVRLPILEEANYPTLTNSPDTFTPDGKWIIGETPEVRNYFVAVGMNGNSIQGAGGIGKAVAEWIIAGEPTQDLLSFDVQRFLNLHNNRQYLQQRTIEIVGRRYSILYPKQSEYTCARKLRCSPLYSILEKRGAIFETRMGFERPLYFDTAEPDNCNRRLPPPTFYRPKFLDFMIEEYYACRNRIGIIDMSSLSKTRITELLWSRIGGIKRLLCSVLAFVCKKGYRTKEKEGQSNCVVDWLQRLCSNDVNIPVGYIVQTGMQNERGGYENDCLLVRKSESNYLMISPTSQQTKGFHWMQRHLPNDGSIDLKDVTSMYTVLNVVGPKATQILSELSDADINLKPFTCKKVNIGYASDVMMMSFTNAGAPGFSLYIPSEYAIHVYDRLITVGDDYGIRDVGALTQRFMRIEKFIPFWAEDLNSNTTPFESGSSYRVKLDKGYFIGKFALKKQKDEGVTKKLVMFTLENLDPQRDLWAWGLEPIYRNDEFVGCVTSAGYGFALQKLICLGYVSKPGYHRERKILKRQDVVIDDKFIMDPTARYEVDVAGTRFLATPHIYPPRVITSAPEYGQNSYRPELATATHALK